MVNKLASLVSKNLGLPYIWVNKFTVTGFLFIFWLLFLDKHNIIERSRQEYVISKLEEEKRKLEVAINQALRDKQDLDVNHEKFAREKHLMHTPDEEIIVLKYK